MDTESKRTGNVIHILEEASAMDMEKFRKSTFHMTGADMMSLARHLDEQLTGKILADVWNFLRTKGAKNRRSDFYLIEAKWNDKLFVQEFVEFLHGRREGEPVQ